MWVIVHNECAGEGSILHGALRGSHGCPYAECGCHELWKNRAKVHNQGVPVTLLSVMVFVINSTCSLMSDTLKKNLWHLEILKYWLEIKYTRLCCLLLIGTHTRLELGS